MYKQHEHVLPNKKYPPQRHPQTDYVIKRSSQSPQSRPRDPLRRHHWTVALSESGVTKRMSYSSSPLHCLATPWFLTSRRLATGQHELCLLPPPASQTTFIFTARGSCASSVVGVVILSVRLSVRSSVCHTRALWLIQTTVRQYFLYHMKGQSF